MRPGELIALLDSGMVEQLKIYYNGHRSDINLRDLPELLPDYQIAKIWNSEDGRGLSILLKDN